MITFTKDELNYEQGKNKEWIVANGLGGYASSTLLNSNTRKYHGLLISSLNPPVERYLQLAKVEEEVLLNKKKYALSTNRYPGTIHPRGFEHLESVVYDVFPTFVYNINGNIIKKSVTMPHGYNATIITYKCITKEPFTLHVRPLVNARPLHDVAHAAQMSFKQFANEKTTTIKSQTPNAPLLVLGTDKGTFQSDAFFVYNMEYEQELERGYAFREDHWSPGSFRFAVKEGVSRYNILAAGGREHDVYNVFDTFYQNHYEPLEHVFDYEKQRINRLIANTCAFHGIKKDALLQSLITAADTFVVKRQAANAPTLIAGYPWFTDWSRDALVSFPGIFLVTGRFDDAREFLTLTAQSLRHGLLPNFYSEQNKPMYNSVDAPLWFILAVYHFANYTGDMRFIHHNLWPAMRDIIRSYTHGTDFRIFVDTDGLVSAGTKGSNLTWMDAQTGTTPIIERYGKAVEVNALWFNALKIMEHYARQFNEDHKIYNALASACQGSFNTTFWNANAECLYDVVRPGFTDASIRPNQIFAVALPFTLLLSERASLVVKKVKDELLTPYGLRSLTKTDAHFQRYYKGNQNQRDCAYHNGTVWGYLLGPFITAYLKVHMHDPAAKHECEEKIVRYVTDSLRDYGVGTLGEIYDGTFPFDPRGCISQAWSVAEMLRAYVEDIKTPRR